LGTGALRDADRAARGSFLDGYLHRVIELGHADLYQSGALKALRAQQVLREMIYAARHLPRWMYVPDGALPELLNEGGQR
jgi:maltokinase